MRCYWNQKTRFLKSFEVLGCGAPMKLSSPRHFLRYFEVSGCGSYWRPLCEANWEVKTRQFVCWLLGLWAVLLTCVTVSERFSGLSIYYMGSYESSVFPLHLQNGSLPPFEIPVFENELMLLPSRMPACLWHASALPKHPQDQGCACLVKMQACQRITSSKAWFKLQLVYRTFIRD